MAKELFTTPKVTAVWPWIQKPDTRFDQEGKYTVSARFDPNEQKHMETLKLLRKLDTEYGAKLPGGKTANKCWRKEKDKEGNDTGMILVNFKSSYKPGLFDAQGNKITEDLNIGSGSIIRISFAYAGYKGFGGGITLYLQGVQLFELKTSSKSMSDFGFEAENGFSISSEDTGFNETFPEPEDDFTPPDNLPEGYDPDDSIPF